MRRIDRDRRQQWVHLPLKIRLRHRLLLLGQLPPAQQPHPMRPQLRQQLLIPAAVLVLHKCVDLLGKHLQRLLRQKTVVAGVGMAILGALQQARQPDLDILVQVAAGYRQKLHPLQHRIGPVLRLLQHPPVKLHPRLVPPRKELPPLRVLRHWSHFHSSLLRLPSTAPGGYSLTASAPNRCASPLISHSGLLAC